MSPLCSISTLLFLGSVAAAQPAREEILIEPYRVDSGIHDGSVDESPIVFQQWIDYPGTPWIRVRFVDYHLGERSFVTLMSLATGEVQRLDNESMEMWSKTSAFLRGDALDLTLHVAPEDKGVFVTVGSIIVPDLGLWQDPGVQDAVASICGDFDNRGGSNDQRVGRIPGCTAWLVSTGVVLTAGHCLTGLPPTLSGVMQFNVPASAANGALRPALMTDQYPILSNTVTWQNNGTGDDFAVFRIGPSADGTGKQAHRAQGFFHMTPRAPPEDATMRVTGHGADNIPPGAGGTGAPCCDADSDGDCDFNCNSTSRTLQTATGRFDQISGDDVIEYEVDTMPANSGSPVIRNSTGFAVGIHTAGGCDDFFAGNENHGTWFGDTLLQTTLNNYLGPNTVFADWANVSDFQFGSALHPAKTISIAVAFVSDGGTIQMTAGNYAASAGNTFTAGENGKAMTLVALVGTVTIGQ